MTLRFTTDYRSRAWNARFPAGQVIDLEGAIAEECLAAGVATEVRAEPVPVPVVARPAVAETPAKAPRLVRRK